MLTKNRIIKFVKLLIFLYLFFLIIQAGFIVPTRSFEPLPENVLLSANSQGSNRQLVKVRSLAIQGKGTSYENGLAYQFRFRLSAIPQESLIMVREYSWFSFIMSKKIDSLIGGHSWQRQNQKIAQVPPQWSQFILQMLNVYSPQGLQQYKTYKKEFEQGNLKTILDEQQGFKAQFLDWHWRYGSKVPGKILFYQQGQLKLRLMLEQLLLSGDKDLWELRSTP